MSVDAETVKRVAHLARIKVAPSDIEALRGELNAILGFVAQLDEVDVTGIEPMTSVLPMAARMRADEVTEGEQVDAVLANAPATDGGSFLVPKVVE